MTSLEDYLNKIMIKHFTVIVLYHAKNHSSFCWKYFGVLVLQKDHKRKRVAEEHLFCNVCLSNAKMLNEDMSFEESKVKHYSSSVSTGNLNRHLRDEHKLQERSIEKSVKSAIKKLMTEPQPSTSREPNIGDKDNLTRDLVLWFCRSLIPFDLISEEGMIDFLKKYNVIIQNEDLPSRYTIAGAALDSVYEIMLSYVKTTILNDVPLHVAITLELWTDRYRRNYVTFILHYLTEDFELKSFTLKTCPLIGNKIYEKIKDMISDIKNDFVLHDKTIFAVIDCKHNLKRAVSLFSLHNVFCLGQGLHNLVINDGIKKVPEIAALIVKCKKILRTLMFCLSELQEGEEMKVLYQALERAGEDIDNDENDPILDETTSLDQNHSEESDVTSSVPSRWHVTLQMLVSINNVFNRDTLNQLFDQSGREELEMSQHEWILLTDLVRFLSKFKNMVNIITSQKTNCINVGLVFRAEIKDALESSSEDETLLLLILKKKMLASFKDRFPITATMAAASLLDCRFQGIQEVDLYLESINQTKISFMASYIKEVITTISEPDLEEEPVDDSSDNTSLLIKLSQKHSAIGDIVLKDPVEQECWKFFTNCKPHDLHDKDILTYWSMKKSEFPWLAALARSILCIPATSISIERIFSVEGMSYSSKRSRLCVNRMHKIMFVHDNYNSCRVVHNSWVYSWL